MPRYLTLVRHAKSSWRNPDLHDIERPLNKRGLRNAPEMGRRLAARGLCPDLIVSSPAVRARVTASAVAAEVGYADADVIEDERLYGATDDAWLEIIREQDAAVEHVMMFGHNPGITDLANRLGATGIDNVPTAGVVRFEHPGDTWAGVGCNGPLVLREFDYPKKDPA